MNTRKWLLLIIVVSVTAMCLYPADVEFPLMQSINYYPYWQHDILPKGMWTGILQMHYSNVYTFNHQRTAFHDFESFSTVIGLRYGLMKNGTLEVFLRHSVIFGGILDKFIEDFHSTFHLPDADRPLYPRNQVRYDYKDAFSYQQSEGGISPMIVSFLTQLHSSNHWSINARAAIGIPLSHKPGFSSDKVSFTGGLIVSYQKKKFKADFVNHVSIVQAPSWLEPEEIDTLMIQSRLELQYCRFIAGFIYRSSVFKEDDVSHNGTQIYLGYRIFTNLEFIFQEDFAPFDTTPDIGFNIRYLFYL